MKADEEKLAKLINQSIILNREISDLRTKILYEENKNKVGLVYNVVYKIRIMERLYTCLFKVTEVDDFGTLIGTLLGKSYDFGRFGYIMIEKESFSLDQLRLEVKSEWNKMLSKFKNAIEINKVYGDNYG